MNILYSQLKNYGKVKLDEPLSRHTTFKIGGPAKYFIVVDELTNFINLISFLDGEGQNYFILGGGSNVLARDEGFEGVVIKTNMSKCIFHKDSVEAEAGVPIATLTRNASDHKLGGLEWSIGLPGTVGGAVYGNAAYSGHYMADIVDRVETLYRGEQVTLSKEDCNFANKESIFKHDPYIILKVHLKLTPLETQEELQKSREFIIEQIRYRTQNQPKGLPSAGCVFKNCEVPVDDISRFIPLIDNEKVLNILQSHHKIPVGYLIEKIGMKGKRIGGAQISPTHANFIVNADNAKAQDVLSLIEEIKEKVYTTYGIELEEEIQII